MAVNAPGKHNRTGLTLMEAVSMFPDDAAAERWFVEKRWPEAPHCPHCGSTRVQTGAAHATMPYRCRERECRRRFSVRTGTVMDSSNIGFQKWAIALFLFSTNLKGVASMKLHRDLGVTQRTAWFMAHRIREAWEGGGDDFAGPVEVDEVHIGGLLRNMHGDQRRDARKRENYAKTIVAGAVDRETHHVAAEVIDQADRATLTQFIGHHVVPTATVYHDDARAYFNIPWRHERVNHSAREYVRGDTHTNSIESFWAVLKRAHKGVFHSWSPKHLHRYVAEFVGRFNIRDLDTIDQMGSIARGMDGKRLRYRDLVGGAPAHVKPIRRKMPVAPVVTEVQMSFGF